MTNKTRLGAAAVLLIALIVGANWLPSGLWPTAEPSNATSIESAATGDDLARYQADEQSEIRATLRLIDSGGPFPYRQDGSEFSNRERRLPQAGSGYYREYTVETPGSPDRGARRIVTGRDGEVYYTSDHYRTFVRLR